MAQAILYATGNGFVVRGATNATFADIRDGAGTFANVSDPDFCPRLTSDTDTDRYSSMRRHFMAFDTSSIGTGRVIKRAVLSLYGTGVTDNFSQSVNIFAGSQANAVTIATTDYNSYGTTAFCDIPIAIGSFNTSGYNDFVLNASGISSLVLNGTSKFTTRLSADYNNTAPTWAASTAADIQIYEYTAGAGLAPKLVIDYSLPGESMLMVF
jgi:hypothetical protein